MDLQCHTSHLFDVRHKLKWFEYNRQASEPYMVWKKEPERKKPRKKSLKISANKVSAIWVCIKKRFRFICHNIVMIAPFNHLLFLFHTNILFSFDFLSCRKKKFNTQIGNRISRGKVKLIWTKTNVRLIQLFTTIKWHEHDERKKKNPIPHRTIKHHMKLSKRQSSMPWVGVFLFFSSLSNKAKKVHWNGNIQKTLLCLFAKRATLDVE